jgi:NodT family efflux transporter outer membrane factor (OMF) lipoprotein
MKPARSLVLTLALLAGCTTVGPDYVRPDLPEPEYADVLQSPSEEAAPSDGPVTPETLADWWKTLDDPLLTQLIEQALAGNLDLRQAQSRVRVARLLAGISQSGLYPQVDGTAVYNRSKTSEGLVDTRDRAPVQETAGTIATGVGVAQTLEAFQNDPAAAWLRVPGQIAAWPVEEALDLENDFYRVGFDAGWEIDIFGGIRRGVEAAEADTAAAQANLEHVWVSLAGAVAQSYVELRTFQARLTVAESNLTAQEETLELLESRYEAGLSDELAVQQVRYVTEGTRALIPALRSGVENALNSLAVLVGAMPGDLHALLAERLPIPHPDLATVTGIPADALRRRPDIRQAERQLAAQTARIGEATAELYPKFALIGSIGLESLDSASLFDAGSDAWSIGPSVSWPIFHAGAIRKNIAVQTELQEQYLAAYEKTVLEAVQEVREALVDYAQEQQRHRSLRRAADAAQIALEVAQDKYRNGLSDFNNVLDAQRAVLAFQEQLALSEGVITINLIRLYKALGGGWAPMSAEDAPSAD